MGKDLALMKNPHTAGTGNKAKSLFLAAALAVALPVWADSNAKTMEAAKAYLNVSTECYNDVFDSGTQYERSRWCLTLYEAHTNYINAGGAQYEEAGHWSSHYQIVASGTE